VNIAYSEKAGQAYSICEKPRFDFSNGDTKNQICMGFEVQPIADKTRRTLITIEIGKQQKGRAGCSGGVPIVRSFF
jgi:hypothetical protein